MPEREEKSNGLRKLERCQYYPFISTDIPEFERRFTLDKFEKLFTTSEPKKTFDFGNRQYIERHSRNTLTQKI